LQGLSTDKSFNNAFVTHNGIVYTWHSDADMVAGTLENGVLHWRPVQTAGPSPWYTHRFSLGISGDSARFVCFIYPLDGEGLDDNVMIKCEFDLNSMTWTRTLVVYDEEDYWDFTDLYHLMPVSDSIHAVHRDAGKTDRGRHLMLNPHDVQWLIIENDDAVEWNSNFIVFSALDNLYKIEYNEEDEYTLVLYRHQLSSNEWEQIREWPSCRRHTFKSGYQVIVNGSRVYVVGTHRLLVASNADATCDRLHYVMVFELNPTLFDIALAAILRNESVKNMATRILPRRLLRLLDRDSTGDSLVPKGICAWVRNLSV
ncbi:hypothetical protein PMAYCL1PPCAC_00757, partial [Pristionchus mayeri]